MGSLEVYYLFEHDDNPVVVDSPEGVGSLLNLLRAESPATAPLLANILVSGDVYSQALDVGVNGDTGVLRYSGREWPAGVVTDNGKPGDDELWYFYMSHVREFPANAEIALSLAQKAVIEFMTTDGARPTCVDWQTDTMLA